MYETIQRAKVLPKKADILHRYISKDGLVWTTQLPDNT